MPTELRRRSSVDGDYAIANFNVARPTSEFRHRFSGSKTARNSACPGRRLRNKIPELTFLRQPSSDPLRLPPLHRFRWRGGQGVRFPPADAPRPARERRPTPPTLYDVHGRTPRPSARKVASVTTEPQSPPAPPALGRDDPALLDQIDGLSRQLTDLREEVERLAERSVYATTPHDPQRRVTTNSCATSRSPSRRMRTRPASVGSRSG